MIVYIKFVSYRFLWLHLSEHNNLMYTNNESQEVYKCLTSRPEIPKKEKKSKEQTKYKNKKGQGSCVYLSLR